MTFVAIVMRGAEYAVGMTLLYLGFFLYESEEGRLENALVELWLRVSDHADTAWKRFARLLDETERISLRVLDYLFGERLLSIRAIAVSSTLAVASFMFTFAPRNHFQNVSDVAPWVTAALLVIASITPALLREPWAIWIPGGITVSVLVMFSYRAITALIHTNSSDVPSVESAVLTSIVATPFIDFGWLTICRKGGRRVLAGHGVLPHVVLILTGVAVTVGTFILPLSGTSHAGFWDRAAAAGLPRFIAYFALSLASTRLFVATLSLIQLIVLLVAFLHWIIWPALSRLIYAAERFNILKERRLFATCGTALLIHASGGAQWLLGMMKVVGLAH